jgi:hypothetical protein
VAVAIGIINMEKKGLILTVEESIACLVQEFIKNPKHFTKEHLLHYKFHDILCGKTSFKIRWEYPTKEFYIRSDGTLKTDTVSSHNARYDIALIDESREVVPFAFEFKLDIDDGSKNIGKDFFREHIRNDYEKLTNPANHVEMGYIIYFLWSEIAERSSEPRLQRKIKQHEINKEILWTHFRECPEKSNLKMIFAECDIIKGNISSRVRTLPEGWTNIGKSYE